MRARMKRSVRAVVADVALPSKFDVREKIKANYPDQALQVHDQGRCGCCWDFAGVGAYEASYLYKQLGKSPALSEQYILDCSDNGCQGGYTDTAFAHLKDKGTFSRNDLNYLGYQGDCAEDAAKYTVAYRASDHGIVAGVDDQTGQPSSNDDLKRALQTYGAIVVGFYATEAFQNTHIGTEDEVFSINESGQPNHAIVLIGYDDDKSWTDVQGRSMKGAWLIKNSWSTTWGAGGYVWIGYGVNSLGTDAAWVDPVASGSAPPTPVNPPQPNPPPTPLNPLPPLNPIPSMDPDVARMSSMIRDRIEFYRTNYPQYLPR
jgi:C1A family cysteine protease